VVYSSMILTKTTYHPSADLGQLLTLLGWNLATWFSIGHIIWCLISLRKFNTERGGKVETREPMMAPVSVANVNRSNQQHLPPIDNNIGGGSGNVNTPGGDSSIERNFPSSSIR